MFFIMGKNFGDRLVGSIGLLLIGILVFLGSFVVLYKTEGRTDLSAIAEKAINVEKAVENGNEDAYVYVTGELEVLQYLSDDLYINQGDYAVMDRKSEMFAWVEEKHTDDNDETYYTYETKWVEDVPNSNKFHDQRRHENPSKAYPSERFFASDVTVGGYNIDIKKVGLPSLEPLKLNEEIVDIYGYEKIDSDGENYYVFDGYGTLQDPEVGDMRYSYFVLPAGEKVTVFGKLDGDSLVSHDGEQEKKTYRIFKGTKSDAKEVLKGEYNAIGWIGKIASFFLMWIGLMLILKPLTVALEIIPVLGKLGQSALGIITFVVALILTFVASFIFSVVQSTIGLIVIAAVVIAIGIYVNTMKQASVSNSKTKK